MVVIETREARRPPRNAFALGSGLRPWLVRKIQLFADLQVASVSRDVKRWLVDQRGCLLEVGCGEQPYAAYVPSRCDYTGIDQSDMTSQFAMENSRTILYYSGDRFPVSDGQFDALFHTEVMEHVFETRAFLRECRRALKPEGAMFFTVPFQARYHFIPHDYFRYTPSALRRLLAEAGFQTITVAPRGNDIAVAAYKAAAVGFRWAYGGWIGKILFLASAPLVVLALLVAHAAMALPIGSSDDCLGYSVTARAGIGGR